ncbi:MAG: cation transporter [Blautia sp.]|nr:cation transporter [Blautia sp.]
MKVRDRNKVIIRTSLIGIAANILLAGFKAIVGLSAHSIAIVLDAVNNFSDALSSVITIIGTRLANKMPDKQHPLGHGRAEYLTAMLVSALVLYAGMTSLVESVKKVINPETASYSGLSLLIMGVAIVVKLILGSFVKARGTEVNSGSLIASGEDARFDAILSASVLASAVIFILTGISLEAYVGLVIAIMIIKSGIEMISEALDDVLGHRPDSELTERIKQLLVEEEPVRGAYDLFLNDYGPDRYYASVHLELPDTMTVGEVDVLTRKLQTKVHKETGVILTGVSVYSYNTSDSEAADIRNAVLKTVKAHDWVLQVHGFYLDTKKKDMRFDVVMSFDIDSKDGLKQICEEVSAMYPDYQLTITPDLDLSD